MKLAVRVQRSGGRMAIRHGAALIVSLWMVLPVWAGQELRVLREIYDADQNDRATGQGLEGSIDWVSVAKRDRLRTQKVLQIRDAGQVKSELDHVHAVTVLLHGPSASSIVQAYGLAVTGLRVHPRSGALLRLRATAWDRLRMTHGRSQWFGTQLVREGQGPMQAYNMDRAVMSETERVALGGQSDAEIAAAVAKADQHSSLPPSTGGMAVRSKTSTSKLNLDGSILNRLMAGSELAAQFYAEAVKVGLPIPTQQDAQPSRRYIYLPLSAPQLKQMAAEGRWPRGDSGMADEIYASVADVTTEVVNGQTLKSTVRIDDKVVAAPVLKVQPRYSMVWTLQFSSEGQLVLLHVQDAHSKGLLYAAP